MNNGGRLDCGTPCTFSFAQESERWNLDDIQHLQHRYSYRGAGKSLARPTSLCTLFDDDNISFDATLVIYINSSNTPPIMIVNRIYEHQNLLLLQRVSFLVGLRTYQHPCIWVSGWELIWL
jgi:hypothetical protein